MQVGDVGVISVQIYMFKMFQFLLTVFGLVFSYCYLYLFVFFIVVVFPSCLFVLLCCFYHPSNKKYKTKGIPRNKKMDVVMDSRISGRHVWVQSWEPKGTPPMPPRL